MAFKDTITHAIITLIIEMPAKRQGLTKLQDALKKTGETIAKRLEAAPDNPKNREKLRHIIAMERWGRRRLQVALGEPFIQDENHPYKPDASSNWDTLKEIFKQTRDTTLKLSEDLKQADLKQTIPHNQFGPLSVLAWLRYLNTHAALESRRIR